MESLFDHLNPRLLARIRLQLALTKSLRSHVSPALGAHCWCSRIDGATLTVTVDGNHQAPLIHYQQRELIKQLNAEFQDQLEQPLRKIRIHVAAHHPERPENPVRPD